MDLEYRQVISFIAEDHTFLCDSFICCEVFPSTLINNTFYARWGVRTGHL